jgi:hypothetical protein
MKRPASAGVKRSDINSIPVHNQRPAGSGFAALRGKARGAQQQQQQQMTSHTPPQDAFNNASSPVTRINSIDANADPGVRFKHDCRLLVDLWEEMRLPMR